ncbi:dihydrofolate reductase family protein [Micromonospora eburnea]|uniref:dihydrofolate reductase family protein n=1 Tax=Micromonospora eburnea TaxID=227316 RepID=UPI000B85644E|nr:dihydrofolate reductase family protein [Micromonospora eburnea]
MRKVIVWMSISLDGFFEGPGGNLSWHRVDDELHQHFNDELRGMSAFLHGRRTYELMADFWPTADRDPASTAPMREYAGIWRDMPKIVYSRSLDRVAWNSTLVPEVVPEQVRALKEQPGGDLTLGGAELAAAFARHGLVDEWRLYLHPVVVGGGRSLFPAGTTLDLELTETRRFGNGVTLLHYR